MGVVHVSVAGRYRVWLQGSLSRRVIVSVGRRLVGSVAYQLGSGGQFTEVGSVQLAAGDQPVQTGDRGRPRGAGHQLPDPRSSPSRRMTSASIAPT